MNPFLAIGLATSMLEDGRWPASGEPMPAPGSILDVTAERVARLSTEARETLLVVASLSPATASEVAAIVGRDPGPTVAAAREAGILADGGDVLRFGRALQHVASGKGRVGAAGRQPLRASDRESCHRAGGGEAVFG